MKRIVRRSFSFVMAVLVLLSTMSFTVEKHFCGQSLIDQAIFTSAERCKNETHFCGVKGIMGHGEMEKDSCCSDKTECILGQDELNIYSVSFDIVPQIFAVPTSFIFLDLLPEVSPEVVFYPPYEPPQLIYDVQLMCQVYTI